MGESQEPKGILEWFSWAFTSTASRKMDSKKRTDIEPMGQSEGERKQEEAWFFCFCFFDEEEGWLSELKI